MSGVGSVELAGAGTAIETVRGPPSTCSSTVTGARRHGPFSLSLTAARRLDGSLNPSVVKASGAVHFSSVDASSHTSGSSWGWIFTMAPANGPVASTPDAQIV